jgi:hypothetical protein
MASELLKKQFQFTRMLPLLLNKAHELGYEVTIGDGERNPKVFGELGVKKGYGNKNSLHKLRLAHDFHLFKDGKYLSRTEDHLPLGEFWESIGGSWGGRFNDGNHYSLEYNG